VSDALAFHQVKSAPDTGGATYPARLGSEIERRFGRAQPDLAATRSRFTMAGGRTPLSTDGERRLLQLARLHATSELYRRLFPALVEEFRPEIAGVYFELVDACGHLFMEDAPPRRAGITEADFLAFAPTVDRCYEYQDEVLGDVLRAVSPRTVTMVVSDHGFRSGEARPATSGRADIASAWPRCGTASTASCSYTGPA
jgi:hypothetical protein